ncbi:hypothetical protein RND71_038983 [Anisodus tanguticus]|uniref:Uncharacterized protein n=1 Tax=Anisodus tanguticus TaxID=243964 RepID=A0AAE1R3A6_9SOLA|nr:hypothetical protein RND71_038983 [Anisodus tanguticus]
MSICDDGLLGANNCFAKQRENIIIDTDPGIDKYMTSLGNLYVFGSSYGNAVSSFWYDNTNGISKPEVEIIGLTTIFGNVTTKDATRNALLLPSEAQYIAR